MNTALRETLLRFVLRLLGSACGLAFFCIFLPYSWMNTVHQHLGLGVLPDQPIVGYLARSLSAFYALFGGLLWVLSFRVAASRTVLLYISASTAAFGVLLLGIDFAEGLPAYWRVFEGPVVILYGVVLWILSVKPLGSHLNN